jgi:YHS domain-containing protein
MIKLILLLALSSVSFSANKKVIKKEAVIEWECIHNFTNFEQSSLQPRTCPYDEPCSEVCPAALKGYYPKPGVKYEMEDYLLPNKTCPVMRGLKARKQFQTKYKGKTVFFYSPGAVKKFNKNPEKYLRNLQLNPKRVKVHPSNLEDRSFSENEDFSLEGDSL